jgi:glutamate dehydrogenase/leucine dehydrogenase
MKKVSLNVWIQLIGLLSVLGGLIFAGLEMRQSQQIALAAQQQARSEVLIDMINTFSEGSEKFHTTIEAFGEDLYLENDIA